MKVLKPLPHAIIDYAWAAQMMSAPWMFKFNKNQAARHHSVCAGATIVGLSLFTRYPLGAVKTISFPAHGVIEAVAGVMTLLAPWTMGFANNKRAKWLHVVSGLGTLAVVAVTDYQAAERNPAERKLRSGSQPDYHLAATPPAEQPQQQELSRQASRTL